MSQVPVTRRPIKVRDSRWAATAAAGLARTAIRPNSISVFSVVFAAVAGLCLVSSCRHGGAFAAGLFITSALSVQLRLLCNLFDGMVAVEGGRKTKSGEIFNELPDRFADAFILAGCGYAAVGRPIALELGWVAAVLAVIAAYVRTLGAATGAGQNFCGPMAKQHRMAIVTAGCIAAAAASVFPTLVGPRGSAWIIWGTLVLMVLGELVTIFRRAAWIVRVLEAK
jgi:phosphatidylglycerophosphate synthase